MLRRTLALVFVLILLMPVGVKAQDAVTLSEAEVDLWPEYDQPSMLVIYHLTLPASVKLPFKMSVSIPASVGKPTAVATRQPDGVLYNLPYDRQVSGDWAVLAFTTTTPEVQIEYYDTSLSKQGGERHFEYTWPGDYAVDSLVIQVLQPKGASNMQISPSLGNGKQANDGLTYYTADEGPLPAGQPFTITVNYTKSSDELTAPSVQVEASNPISETSVGLSSLLPWLLAGLGVLLIAGGALWYWQSGREQPARSQRRSRRSTISAPPVGEDPAEGGYVYCHQCGKRAAPGDRFCRTCGTQLRAG